MSRQSFLRVASNRLGGHPDGSTEADLLKAVATAPDVVFVGETAVDDEARLANGETRAGRRYVAVKRAAEAVGDLIRWTVIAGHEQTNATVMAIAVEGDGDDPFIPASHVQHEGADGRRISNLLNHHDVVVYQRPEELAVTVGGVPLVSLFAELQAVA
ncbi:MAG TPA: hypothetical protein VLI54_06135 [Bacillota bacterium]|nr:hypothetical protein [Bacillota bacterium]